MLQHFNAFAVYSQKTTHLNDLLILVYSHKDLLETTSQQHANNKQHKDT